jgi:uncharacterized protein
MEERYPSEYCHGIELYNAGKFYEAHEVWEEIWRKVEGEERLFYQGLIQVAAALIHHNRGNLRGVQIVLPKALAKLETLPPTFMSLDLNKFTALLRDFFAYAIDNEDETIKKDDERSFPKIKIDKAWR